MTDSRIASESLCTAFSKRDTLNRTRLESFLVADQKGEDTNEKAEF
jgi:hypothetical protein